MKKNLVKEALKNEFFVNKDKIIDDYLAKNCEGGTQVLTYTNGTKAVATLYDNKVYTRNGFFFSVILKDDNYIENLNEEEYIAKLEEYYSKKYEDIEIDDEPELLAEE